LHGFAASEHELASWTPWTYWTDRWTKRKAPIPTNYHVPYCPFFIHQRTADKGALIPEHLATFMAVSTESTPYLPIIFLFPTGLPVF